MVIIVSDQSDKSTQIVASYLQKEDLDFVIFSDERAYLTEPSNIYSKPLKCGYNPYTGEWAN